jgi:hypothetical protein
MITESSLRLSVLRDGESGYCVVCPKWVPPESDRLLLISISCEESFAEVTKTAAKSGKQIQRSVISSFRIAESMGFKGDFRQSEDLLRIGD